MSKSDVLIIGYGVVGSNLAKEIGKLKPDIVDKYKGIPKQFKKHHIGFVCVDTPLTIENTLNVTEVFNAVDENDCDIYVIKSTCPVGTVDLLSFKTGKKVLFSPEYYGGTQHCNNFKFDFTILGGDKEVACEVIQMLQHCYDGRHQFKIVDSKVAELCKFMENSFLAMKVSFCVDFYNACKKNDVNYEELRECFILDPRVNASHTFVYEDKPYWDSHCLNKDVPCIAYTQDMPLMKAVVECNNFNKNK